MSAKISVIVYILICFEIGIMLLILPWLPQFWDDNFFLFFLSGKLNATWLPDFLTSKYVRGAVSGLGALNILAGLRDIFKFRESVEALLVPDLSSHEETQLEPSAAQTAALSDQQPPSVPPQG